MFPATLCGRLLAVVTGAGGWDFFVSYAADDVAWAEWIAWQIEEDGHAVLVQAWDFVPGSHWTSRMADGIGRATRTIAVLSPAYLTSVYGRREWEAAFRADPEGLARRLVPVRVVECEAPDLLGGVVGIDLFDLPEPAARAHLLDRLRAALDGRAKPASEPRFPGPGAGTRGGRSGTGAAGPAPAFPGHSRR